MTNLLPPIDKELNSLPPRSVAEAIGRLLITLSPEEKAEIAGMAEDDLIDCTLGLA